MPSSLAVVEQGTVLGLVLLLVVAVRAGIRLAGLTFQTQWPLVQVAHLGQALVLMEPHQFMEWLWLEVVAAEQRQQLVVVQVEP